MCSTVSYQRHVSPPLPPFYDVVLPKDRLARHCHEEILEAVPGGDFGAVTSRLRRWSNIAIQGIINAGMRLSLKAEFCWMGIPVIRVPHEDQEVSLRKRVYLWRSLM